MGSKKQEPRPRSRFAILALFIFVLRNLQLRDSTKELPEQQQTKKRDNASSCARKALKAEKHIGRVEEKSRKIYFRAAASAENWRKDNCNRSALEVTVMRTRAVPPTYTGGCCPSSYHSLWLLFSFSFPFPFHCHDRCGLRSAVFLGCSADTNKNLLARPMVRVSGLQREREPTIVFHSSVQPTFRLDRQREPQRERETQRELRRACGLCETLNSKFLLFFLTFLLRFSFFFLLLSLSLFLCLCYVIRSRVRTGESEQAREREREHIARPKQMAWKIGETFTFSSQRHGLTHSKRAKRETVRERQRQRERE